MKKYLVLILAVGLFACSQETGFKINVELEGADGEVLLEKRVAGEWVSVDTAKVENGLAILEGEVTCPEAHYLSIVGQRSKTVVFVENAKMTAVGKADSLDLIAVNGSAAHNEFAAINAEMKVVAAKYMAIYQDARAAGSAGDTAKANLLMKEVNTLYESVGKMQEEFVNDNPASYVTPLFLAGLMNSKDVEELDEIVGKLDPKLDEVQILIDIKARIAKLKSVAVGQIAPDFTQNDMDGNPIKFSDIYSKNELTLLDFWASWCGPCRRENPNVVSVYNEFKDKGFGVFGVSLDRDKAAWVKAIEDDKLTWPHVSDLAYWQNAAAQLYLVNSIPMNLLVDKNGKIVAKKKVEKELHDIVSELLK